jgi:CheY-like chemotaxis protein
VSAGARRPRVLLVEDDESNRVTAAALLEDAGFLVDTAASFAAAREHLTAGAGYDLLVADHHLGDGEGPDLVPLLRARMPAARALLVSGEATPAGACAADAFVEKGATSRCCCARPGGSWMDRSSARRYTL